MLKTILRFASVAALACITVACGGSGGGGSRSGISLQSPSNDTIQPNPTASAVTQVPIAGGTLSLYDDGTALLSTPSGGTISAYSGSRKIKAILPVPEGVQAKFDDGSVFLSSDGLNLGGGGQTVMLPHWTRIVANAEFGRRDSARGIRFGGKIWLSGGFFGSTTGNYFDLWSSNDNGRSWSLSFGHPKPESGPLGDFYDAHSPIVTDGTGLIAVGNTVWKSADGVNWVSEPTPGPQMATDDTHAFYLNGKFIFFDTAYGTIYSSADARQWTVNPTPLPMSARCGAATILAFGKIWLYGGGDCGYSNVRNDIWSSDDGINWG